MSNFSCYPCGPRAPRPGPCTGATGPTGPTGAAAATIPFSVSTYGSQMDTDEQGSPSAVLFAGFGGTTSMTAAHLQPGEWESGIINITEEEFAGNLFVMPRTAVLKTVHVMFSSKLSREFTEGVTIRPFAVLAVSLTNRLTFTILKDTLTYTEPYTGGIEYPKHEIRRGMLTNLNVSIPEGAITAIIVGIRADNTTEDQYGMFNVGGGLYFE